MNQATKEKRMFADFISFMEYYISLCKDGTILNSKGGRLAAGTIQSYASTLKIVKQYCANRRIKLRLDGVTVNFYNDFVKFMNEASHSRGKYKPNAIGKFVKSIKAMLRYAYENNYTANDDFKRKEFKVYKENVETVYLTEKELDNLYNLELNEGESCVRDSFIVSSYTGLRYSDIARLQQKHLDFDNKLLTIVTQKTNTLVVIPMHPKVEAIFLKYGNQPPAVQSNQSTNRILKKLCRKAGINCIYLMPFANSNAIYVYDLAGKPLRSIPLHQSVSKAVFKVDADKRELTVGALPFTGYPFVAWVQDFEGHLLDSVPAARHLSVLPDYSNEVMYGANTEVFDLYISTFFELRPDTLYHYIRSESRLKPRFTLNIGDRKRSITTFYELPQAYVGRLMVEEQVSDGMWETKSPSNFIVDKASLRGTFFRVINDFAGGMPDRLWTPWSLRNKQYIRLVEPGVLKAEIESYLSSTDGRKGKNRKKLQELCESIGEEDNSYVIYAKQKGVQ